MITSSELISSSRKLLADEASQSDLRRAVSTAYYSVFHHLCSSFSAIVLSPDDCLFERATLQAYRYLDHGSAKSKCLEASNVRRNFPPGIVVFAKTFVDLQERRLEADYEPFGVYKATIVRNLINDAERSIAAHDSESPEHRRAFAIFVALRQKGRG